MVCLPLAWVLSYHTGLSLPWVVFFVHCADNILKGLIAGIMLKSGIWAKNVVNAAG